MIFMYPPFYCAPRLTTANGEPSMTKKVYVKTFGCQMNEYDSDKMVDVLGAAEGLVKTDSPEDADVILFNTCSVREKEIGSFAIFMILRILSSGISILIAKVAGSGSAPVSCKIWRLMRFILLMVSIMCTGMRIVRAWSAIENVIACRIHHVA